METLTEVVNVSLHIPEVVAVVGSRVARHLQLLPAPAINTVINCSANEYIHIIERVEEKDLVFFGCTIYDLWLRVLNNQVWVLS